MYIYSFPSPIGSLGIAANEQGITHIFPASSSHLFRFPIKETDLISEAALQLHEFFSGERSSFSLPLSPQGTQFQHKVWNTLLRIPYGSAISYKQLALLTDCPNGFRAVGQANHRNPLPILIPCHRVIAADGTLGGYSLGSELKSWLLNLEHSASLN